jgi:hypothetical protein
VRLELSTKVSTRLVWETEGKRWQGGWVEGSGRYMIVQGAQRCACACLGGGVFVGGSVQGAGGHVERKRGQHGLPRCVEGVWHCVLHSVLLPVGLVRPMPTVIGVHTPAC